MPEVGAEARALLARVQRVDQMATEVLGAEKALRALAHEQLIAVRAALVADELRGISIGRLKGTTQGRLRLGPIEQAGYRTIADLLAAPDLALQMIPGVGPQTVTQAKGAARQVARAAEEGIRVRLDPDRRDPTQTALLRTLRVLEDAEQMTVALSGPVAEFRTTTGPLGAAASRARSKVTMLFSRARRKEESLAALAELDAWMASPTVQWLDDSLSSAHRTLNAPQRDESALWADYSRRSVEYNGLLGEIGDLDLDVDASQGFIPDEIAEQVNQQLLDDQFLTVGLRGYQAFGARFALVQRRTILGDEMGLGKTIEALAALAHLRSIGATHFLVVCPASVLVNWMQEIERRTHRELRCYRLHGRERFHNHKIWLDRGGIAVTTFTSLQSMPVPANAAEAPAMIVVDEAHYAKNPKTLRSKGVRAWTDLTERVLFMTGTPMENRVEEFQTLLGYLQPQVAKAVDGATGIAGPIAFRKAVAPAYLRRNQSDVLTELPERLDMEDWVEFGDLDTAAYIEAVKSRNFMAMRRAAYLPGSAKGSAKLARLVDIVEESEANGWKVVVFSYFRDVLRIVDETLGNTVVGQLTGSVSPTERQALVDEFTRIDGHSVLVSQIEAGGVGLNIQAGSVVVLCEPQWKPSTEEQAIARCHRMGQVRRVRVHRLLAENSVDRRMLDIVRTKSMLFDEYARQSGVKDANPEAVDISDIETAQRLAAIPEAQAEAEIIRLEAERLQAATR